MADEAPVNCSGKQLAVSPAQQQYQAQLQFQSAVSAAVSAEQQGIDSKNGACPPQRPCPFALSASFQPSASQAAFESYQQQCADTQAYCEAAIAIALGATPAEAQALANSLIDQKVANCAFCSKGATYPDAVGGFIQDALVGGVTGFIAKAGISAVLDAVLEGGTASSTASAAASALSSAEEAAPASAALDPYEKGLLGRLWSEQRAMGMGWDIVGREVPYAAQIAGKSELGTADLIARTPDGEYVLIESKFSPAASFTPAQQAIFPALAQAGNEGLPITLESGMGDFAAGNSIRVTGQVDVWNSSPNMYDGS